MFEPLTSIDDGSNNCNSDVTKALSILIIKAPTKLQTPAVCATASTSLTIPTSSPVLGQHLIFQNPDLPLSKHPL